MPDPSPDSNSGLGAGSDLKPSEACWVVKLGGSLLDLPDLGERVRAVIRRVSTKPLLVVGGGAAADLVRRWQETHPLSPSAAHWLAVRAMEFNQHLIETLLPEAVAVSCSEQAAEVWQQNGIALLDAWEWLQKEEARPDSLPHSWEVTSDSIAAWAALRWQAHGLVLLKSLDAPHSQAALSECVDEHFPRFLPKLPQFAWCNLRTDCLEVATLRAKP